MGTLRLATSIVFSLVLMACASAPRSVPSSASGPELAVILDEPHSKRRRYLDAVAVSAVSSIAPPRVVVAEGVVNRQVSEAQAALVANRAARGVCEALAPFVVLKEDGADAQVTLHLLALRPTSPGAAGFSELLGIFVPGPFRLPAGLGGLAMEGEARRGDEVLLRLYWSEGADAFTEGARISRIGDAYQLAVDFADDFADALVDRPDAEAGQRPRLEESQRAANEALCLKKFGQASRWRRGAAVLLPLAPEAIDAGAPIVEGGSEDPNP